MCILIRACDVLISCEHVIGSRMNSVLQFSNLFVVAVIFAPFVSIAETNTEACSPSNTNIEIDAQVPGVISTPVFPDGYAGSTCTWKIQAPNNFRLSITVEVLQLQGEDDYLVIRDGSSALTPLIGKYGPCASGSVTLFSSGSSAFLQTVSAVFSSKDELRIRYRPTDPDDIDCSNQAENPPNLCSPNTKLTKSSGVLSSPNFPNNYDANEYCLWSIVAPQGYRVQVNIKWFGIEELRYSRHRCGDDSLKISEFRGNDTKDVETLCGCQELFSHVSYNEKLWLTFSSFKKANWPGFYVTYQTIAPDECPAGSTSCPMKIMAPVGFNAQGQVCTASVKSSSQVMASSSTSLLRPSSAVQSLSKTSRHTLEKSIHVTSPPRPSSVVESLAKTSSHTMENRTRVTSSSATVLLATSHVRSSAKRSIQVQKTSTPVAKPTGTFSLVPSTHETHVLVTKSPVLSLFLKTSHMASSAKQRSVLDTSTSVVLPLKSTSSVASSVTSLKNVANQTLEKSATTESTESTNLQPTTKVSTIEQIQTRVIVFSSTVTSTRTTGEPDLAKTMPLSVLRSSEVKMHVSSINSKGRESSIDVDNTLVYATKQTGILKPAASSLKWSKSIEDMISGTSLVEVKDRETIAPVGQLKHSRTVSSSFDSSIASRKIFHYGTSVTEATKHKEASRVTELKSDVIKPSVFSGYTLKSEETTRVKVSTANNFKTVASKVGASVSTKYGQRNTLVVRSTYTGPIRETRSLAQSDHVTSQNEHVTPASVGNIIQPSKASMESKGILSLTQTTPVERTTTKEPPVTTEEPDVQVIEGKDSPPPGFTIKCTYYAMEIIISRMIVEPNLVISSLHLQDPSCKVIFSNNTHALLIAPLESCDTEQTISEHYFIYSNNIMGDAKSGSSDLVTREGRIKYAFQCSYQRIHVISIVSFSTRKKEVRISSADGTGKFTYEMDMFKNSTYNVMVSQYPVNVHPGETMYFQVDVKSRNQSLIAFLDECWVTPTKDPRDQTRYTLIEHGCPRDSTLEYIYKKSPTQKFTFQAFQFRKVPSSRLYVHCEVLTCRRSDTGSVCDTGCKENRRQRRENKPYIMDKDLILSLGPVNFREETAESHTSTVYIQALTGLLGVLCTVLLTAMVIIILRKRKRDKKTWSLLSSRTQRMQDETSSKLMTTEL